MRPSRFAPATVAVLLGTVLLAACGPPPDVAPTPEGPLPTPALPGSPTGPAPAPQPPASAPATDDDAVDCAGDPDADQVLDVLREEFLDGDSEPEVTEGPLCAEDWQFAVVSVPDRDPLQVITSGPADGLQLVTAGTDVCTVEVRVHAPAGIRSAAGCVG